MTYRASRSPTTCEPTRPARRRASGAGSARDATDDLALERSGDDVGTRPHRLDTPARLRRQDGDDGQGLRQRADPRRLHGARRMPDHAASPEPAVVRGDHTGPYCEHGDWTFACADYTRKAPKWRCPTGDCKPASVWVKADRLHPPSRKRRAPRSSTRAVARLSTSSRDSSTNGPCCRSASARDRVALHADLTIPR
ncbi:MAG: hypothetical protein QOI48_477 [Solirubrobacteraceae bacterium]|jgi:hypothetical protein|nr:hypothetical protein [Solirubrobacteraceae bacterium]